MTDKLHVELIKAGFYGERAQQPKYFCPYAECCGASLSELVEACAEKFGELERTFDGWWRASDHDYITVIQDTDKENAVARLWLALNKKV